MIKEYLDKSDDFSTYVDASEIAGDFFLARVVQDDLERIKIESPHIMRVLHGMENEIMRLSDEIESLKNNNKIEDNNET